MIGQEHSAVERKTVKGGLPRWAVQYEDGTFLGTLASGEPMARLFATVAEAQRAMNTTNRRGEGMRVVRFWTAAPEDPKPQPPDEEAYDRMRIEEMDREREG